MEESNFKVEQIDHIHVYVPDQYEAAKWYKKVLGLEIVQEYEDWSNGGPLTISSDGGSTSLALFKGETKLNNRVIAFRVDGKGFLTFLKQLSDYEIKTRDEKVLTARDVVDHDRSYSVYFNDPYGNPYELTTYDYSYVKDNLKNLEAEK
jgi:catechol 2,3-dioxygenase-like lactoylglutathione lyase family enzyme